MYFYKIYFLLIRKVGNLVGKIERQKYETLGKVSSQKTWLKQGISEKKGNIKEVGNIWRCRKLTSKNRKLYNKQETLGKVGDQKTWVKWRTFRKHRKEQTIKETKKIIRKSPGTILIFQ